MARPKKIGLGYFPLDCQMDDKVEMLEAEHGLEGFAVYIKLLQSIYQTDAGELEMSVVFRWKTLAKSWGLPVERLREFVDTMLEVALFDKTAFSEREVLTSSGIQKRISTVAGLRDKDRVRKTTETGGFPYGKQVENIRKSTQKEKEKEKETTDVVAAAPEPLKAKSKSERLAGQVAADGTDTFTAETWKGLNDPQQFATICKSLTALKLPINLDTEAYRESIRRKVADRGMDVPASTMRNFIESFFMKLPTAELRTIDASLPTVPTPQNELPPLRQERPGQIIAIAGIGNDESMNRMKIATYQGYWPTAQIHAILPR